MYVKEICLEGFKSYAMRMVVPNFDQFFNAITGLNGSGKSNILDSICFVMGITNMQQVMASNLQELVYKKGQAGVTKATVSIVFDNSNRSRSPISYEDCSEITVTRQVFSLRKPKTSVIPESWEPLNGCDDMLVWREKSDRNTIDVKVQMLSLLVRGDKCIKSQETLLLFVDQTTKLKHKWGETLVLCLRTCTRSESYDVNNHVLLFYIFLVMFVMFLNVCNIFQLLSLAYLDLKNGIPVSQLKP